MESDIISRNIAAQVEDEENKKKLSCLKILIAGANMHSHQICSMLKDSGIQNIDIIMDSEICNKSVSDYSLIIDCLQNFRGKFELNKICVKNKIPLIFSHITESSCQTTAVIPDETPCLCCLFEESDVEEFETENNSELLPIISKLQTGLIKDLILNSGETDTGNLLTYYSKSEDFQKVRLSKNKHCPVCSKIKTII